MSFQAMTWAVEQELPALQKLVLLMLANCSNHHTGQCNPSHERLAKECGMSKDSVKRAISELAEKGLLDIRRLTKDGVNLPNQYSLKVGSSVRGVGADSTGGGCSEHRGVGADSTTKQEVKPGSKPKATRTTLPDGFSISESVSNWAVENGHDRLEKRLAHFVGYVTANGKTYADWDAAFRNAIRDNWARLPERSSGNGAVGHDARYVN
jgi:DNA-binding transcriptional MocR family regulator